MSGDDTRKSLFSRLERAEALAVARLTAQVKVYTRDELESYAAARGFKVAKHPITNMSDFPEPAANAWKGRRKKRSKA